MQPKRLERNHRRQRPHTTIPHAATPANMTAPDAITLAEIAEVIDANISQRQESITPAEIHPANTSDQSPPMRLCSSSCTSSSPYAPSLPKHAFIDEGTLDGNCVHGRDGRSEPLSEMTTGQTVEATSFSSLSKPTSYLLLATHFTTSRIL